VVLHISTVRVSSSCGLPLLHGGELVQLDEAAAPPPCARVMLHPLSVCQCVVQLSRVDSVLGRLSCLRECVAAAVVVGCAWLWSSSFSSLPSSCVVVACDEHAPAVEEGGELSAGVALVVAAVRRQAVFVAPSHDLG